MSDHSIKELGCAIIMQAVKDYFAGTEKQKCTILKDLRSSYMDMLTNGLSVVTAEQLEKHPNEIAERLRRNPENMV
jgi:hypothetical protein